MARIQQQPPKPERAVPPHNWMLSEFAIELRAHELCRQNGRSFAENLLAARAEFEAAAWPDRPRRERTRVDR